MNLTAKVRQPLNLVPYFLIVGFSGWSPLRNGQGYKKKKYLMHNPTTVGTSVKNKKKQI